MRRIKLQPLNTTSWNRWLRDCDREIQALIESVDRGEKPEFKEKLYGRTSIKKGYFASKAAPFYGKCAYCESYITDFQHGDIEHFRPKGGITDEKDNQVVLKDDRGNPTLNAMGEPKPHPGYYWLAYNWQNLLPSCAICNQPSSAGNKKIGKHNRFPVDGNHAQRPEDVESEQPLLINPASDREEDDPTKHLAVDISTGLMFPLSARGKMCIEIFGLNLRDQLVNERRRACREVIFLLAKLKQNNAPDPFIELETIRDGKRSYSMAAIATLNEQLSKLKPLLDNI
jgi:hypothetical protein